MPIYEYVCRSCDHELEQLQRLSDEPLTECPACGAATLKRKVSAAGFRLSGGGWYETDFKSDGRRNLSGDKDSSDSKSGDDSKKSGEAASPSKTESAPAKNSSDGDKTAKKKPQSDSTSKKASNSGS